VLLVTTLNNFRSDYNLVPIPDGNFLAAREQLYVNINLLRMGCSGRSALTLEEPRYIFPDPPPGMLTICAVNQRRTATCTCIAFQSPLLEE
jgi:hypothetical protein